MKKLVETYPRDFEGVWIPKEIYLNENLNALDKIIFTEINSLDRHNEEGGDYCYASNEYLAEFCGCSKRKVTDTISKLIKMELIKVVKTDGRKRWMTTALKGCLANFASQNSEKCKAEKNNLLQSNISINTIINTNKIDKYNRSISEGNTTKLFSFDIVENQINKICKTDEEYDSEFMVGTFKYYYECYEWKLHTHHPKLYNENIAEILHKYYYEMYGAEYISLNDMYRMIQIHFTREYGMEIDYNINHFFSEGIMDLLADEVGA